VKIARVVPSNRERRAPTSAPDTPVALAALAAEAKAVVEQ
jgi:hypothetical protein